MLLSIFPYQQLAMCLLSSQSWPAGSEGLLCHTHRGHTWRDEPHGYDKQAMFSWASTFAVSILKVMATTKVVWPSTAMF